MAHIDYTTHPQNDMIQIRESLRDKEFNTILDNYLMDGSMKANDYTELDPYQTEYIQTLKRAFARVKRKMTPFIPETKYIVNKKNE